MIAFGCATTSEETFRAGAAEAIERSAERDSPLLRRHGHDDDAIGALCNEMLDWAAAQDDLEAFVLLAEEAAAEDGSLAARVRRWLATRPDDAVIAGDGAVVLPPRAARELRFDAALAVPFDCAVADLRHQTGARGYTVVAHDLGLTRTSPCKQLGDRARLVRGHVAVRRKWEADLERGGGRGDGA